MKTIQATAGLTKEQAIEAATGFRIATADRKLIESNLRDSLIAKNKSVDQFFTVEIEDGHPLVPTTDLIFQFIDCSINQCQN